MRHALGSSQSILAIFFALLTVLSLAVGVVTLGTAPSDAATDSPLPAASLPNRPLEGNTTVNDTTSEVETTLTNPPPNETNTADGEGPEIPNNTTAAAGPATLTSAKVGSNATGESAQAAVNCTKVSRARGIRNVSSQHRLPGMRDPLTMMNGSGTPTKWLPGKRPPATTPSAGRAAVPNITERFNNSRGIVPAGLRGACQLAELYSAPEWVRNIAAGQAANESRTTRGAASVDAYNTSTPEAHAQLSLAHDLRAIFTDMSRSQRAATLDAAERALSARQHTTPSQRPGLAAERAKLRHASALLNVTETSTPTGSLTRAVDLASVGFKQQGVQMAEPAHPAAPSNVTLPAPPTPSHDRPSAAAFAILKAQNVSPSATQAAEIRGLDELPEPTRSDLTGVLDAYLGYYLTTQAVATGAPKAASPTPMDVKRIRAAQLRLLERTAVLQTSLNDTDSPGLAGTASHDDLGGNVSVQVSGVLSIDLTTHNHTYEEDYRLQIDRGGNDTYTNNAGGAKATGNSIVAAALIDLEGSDSYYGRNGGGWYNRTKDTTGTLKQKGGAAGFLVDAGTGNDTYKSTTSGVYLKDTYSGLKRREKPPGSLGTNGGGRRATGFLVDTGGNDRYDAGNAGTNGGGSARGVGFLLDVGTGSDTYQADGGGSNGGGSSGHGFLFDAGGNDRYTDGSNGGAGGKIGTPSISLPYLPYVGQIPGLIGPTPEAPHSGGFLVDASGSDTYTGRNGGAGTQARGFLLDAGLGDDVYDGNNGGTTGRGGTGMLLDVGGDDTYLAGNGGTNGGGRYGGNGFLVDGGAGDDTYDTTTEGEQGSLPPGSLGTNGGGVSDGKGALIDGGGDDSYRAGSVGTNGGARGIESMGFLWDTGGNDTYHAKEVGVNGGAASATALLYDNAGTDFYQEYTMRCRDCSDIPKGTVGAQLDRGSGERDDSQVSEPEVLVVDDDAGTPGAECPAASYQTIQPAVAAAEFGDTVRVCAGTYAGEVTMETPNVTLQASRSASVELDGHGTQQFGVALVAGQTSVFGFTATNFSAGFVTSGPETTVANTTVKHSQSGIISTGLFSDSLLQETPAGGEDHTSVIRNNTVASATFGIRVDRTGNVNISSNTVTATQYGIPLRGGAEVTIHNNTVSGYSLPRTTPQRGISSVFSSEITMLGNNVTGFTAPKNRSRPEGGIGGVVGYGYGIEIRFTQGTGEETAHTLRNNRMANNSYNLLLQPRFRGAYQHFDIDTSNTVNGKPVVYRVGAVNLTIGPAVNPGGAVSSNNSVIAGDEAPGYVACVQCVNVTIRDLTLAHNGQGILIAKSRDMRVDNVTVHDTWRGISVMGSPTNTVVTNSTVRESYTAIAVRHNCGERREFRVEDSIENVMRGNAELCANPSVIIANNTIQQTGFLFETGQFSRYLAPGNALLGYGGAITVTGTGVTVRANNITDALGAGISMRVRQPYTGSNGVVGTGLRASPDTVVESTVADNSISNAYIGVSVLGSQGTNITGNNVTATRIGFFNIFNRDLVYRDNIVTNATFGMAIHWADMNIRARNNSFRDVRWGLDVRFTWFGTPPRAQSTHDFGTTNTVNGERIIWLNGATHRTIDAADANMVVCVRCTDVTVRDMTLTDNTHGVVFWDTKNSTVANVTITDALNTGVLLRAGQNNVVRNSTIIDSAVPIFAEPIEGRREEKNQREIVGQVRIENNRIAVENASWTDPVHQQGYQHPVSIWQKPMAWGHMGIWLFNPTVATVTGNNVTDNRWGVVQTISVGDAFEACVGPGPCDPPARGYDLRITDNTVTHATAPRGLDRFGQSMVSIFGQSFGIKVNSEQGDVPNASVVVRNNTLTHGTQPHGGRGLLTGVRVDAHDVPSITLAANRVQGYQQSVVINARGENTSSIAIRRNRLTGASFTSVAISGATPGTVVDIHQNLLQPMDFFVPGYGVYYGGGGGGGGHMGDSDSEEAGTGVPQPVNATCNRWGAPSGPTSRHMSMAGTLTDPVTSEPADGNGSAVSQGDTHGESNVRFHPWLGESPGLSCTNDVAPTSTPGEDDHGDMNHTHSPTASPTPTESPTPTPTATPTPTPTATPPSGSGGGDGTGPSGGGTGGTGGGGGGGSTTGSGSTNPSQEGPPDDTQRTATATATSTATSTAESTATPIPETPTPTPTPSETPTPTPTPTDTPTSIPTPTPEVVPGFDVGSWVVAVVMLLGVLAARRRDGGDVQ